MVKKYILAIDQGTTGSRAFLFDKKCKIIGSAYAEFKQYFPKPGWVEHDAEEIWQSCVDVIKKVLDAVQINSKNIISIGITNQRETTVLWDRKTSKPVAKAIVWQCRRTADICHSLKGREKTFHKKTGLRLDPYFSGTKIKWYLDNVKGLKKKVEKGNICFGTIDSWLIWKLTGGASHVTDMTNASRTLLFNICQKKWDKKLCSILDIPVNILPKVQKSGSIFGYTKLLEKNCLPEGIPISAVLGDQQAALYGQGCFSAGTIKNTYGTGCFLVLNTGNKLVVSKKGLLSTIASDEKGNPVYALEGSIFIAGAVIQWLRDQLGIIKSAAETEDVVKGLKDSAGVYCVPAFTGLGAPYWDSEARGIISGLTRGANAKHIVRAALESIAYQTKDVFNLFQEERGAKIKDMQVDGGGCVNDFLMQFQADILNCNIVRPKVTESTVRGVAQLAGVTVGLWNGKKDLQKLQKIEHIFKPQMLKKQREELYAGWQKAVKKARA